MGDILQINQNESFPTDMVLLYAEKEPGVPVDIIFIETMNLDGETNLKPRKQADNTIKSIKDLKNYTAEIEYDAPNENLDRWDGKIIKDNVSEIMINKETLLLWGCVLKNTY